MLGVAKEGIGIMKSARSVVRHVGAEKLVSYAHETIKKAEYENVTAKFYDGYYIRTNFGTCLS